MSLRNLTQQIDPLVKTDKMPVLFVGHGNPMNAIVKNDFHNKWISMGKTLPRPQAILMISAHWITTNTTKVTAMKTPETIHDFGGFPKELFDQQYPAPGSPEMAKMTAEAIHSTIVHEDMEWGLDHGTWSVLKPMFPEADIPVYQISIDYGQPAAFHYKLGQELQTLRKKGVLIIGSGNIVHNLRELKQGGQTYDWAYDFDENIRKAVDARDFQQVIDFQNMGTLAKMAHPSYDHFLPLLYTLGAVDKKEEIEYFNDDFDMGSISMRSLLIHS